MSSHMLLLVVFLSIFIQKLEGSGLTIPVFLDGAVNRDEAASYCANTYLNGVLPEPTTNPELLTLLRGFRRTLPRGPRQQRRCIWLAPEIPANNTNDVCVPGWRRQRAYYQTNFQSTFVRLIRRRLTIDNRCRRVVRGGRVTWEPRPNFERETNIAVCFRRDLRGIAYYDYNNTAIIDNKFVCISAAEKFCSYVFRDRARKLDFRSANRFCRSRGFELPDINNDTAIMQSHVPVKFAQGLWFKGRKTNAAVRRRTHFVSCIRRTCDALRPILLSASPSSSPTYPSINPTTSPSHPTLSPSASPSLPTLYPTSSPSAAPSSPTTDVPTISPGSPTLSPSSGPTESPTLPTLDPTSTPTISPSTSPSISPSQSPTTSPTNSPSSSPSSSPSVSPSQSPTTSPTKNPSSSPSSSPSVSPSQSPTTSPTKNPTNSPSVSPSQSPTTSPTKNPTDSPSVSPSQSPTTSPTKNPTDSPSSSPTDSPSTSPTNSPTVLWDSKLVLCDSGNTCCNEYLYIAQALPYQDARAFCIDNGFGDLVSIHSQNEHLAIRDFLINTGKQNPDASYGDLTATWVNRENVLGTDVLIGLFRSSTPITQALNTDVFGWVDGSSNRDNYYDCVWRRRGQNPWRGNVPFTNFVSCVEYGGCNSPGTCSVSTTRGRWEQEDCTDANSFLCKRTPPCTLPGQPPCP